VDGEPGVASGELLSYVRANPEFTLVTYSPLLGGAYVRADRPLHPSLDHPGTAARLTALREVAGETGATPNQVVLAWLIGGDVPMIPLMSASSVAQLDENLEAADLELTPEQRAKLDSAY
jgi:aryl-alcohol dehydrogenase-like predicted oxidoreductase